jgi:hypothetical protein
MPVRLGFCAIYKRAEHSEQLLEVKNDDNLKKFIQQLAIDNEFFRNAFSNPCTM